MDLGEAEAEGAIGNQMAVPTFISVHNTATAMAHAPTVGRFPLAAES